jgi:hypothetical protein
MHARMVNLTMKIYPFILLVLVGQTFITLPIQKTFIVTDNLVSEEEVYIILGSGGLGPAILFKQPGMTITQIALTHVAQSEQTYFAIYLGNLALDIALATCVIEVYRIEKR